MFKAKLHPCLQKNEGKVFQIESAEWDTDRVGLISIPRYKDRRRLRSRRPLVLRFDFAMKMSRAQE